MKVLGLRVLGLQAHGLRYRTRILCYHTDLEFVANFVLFCFLFQCGSSHIGCYYAATSTSP